MHILTETQLLRSSYALKVLSLALIAALCCLPASPYLTTSGVQLFSSFSQIPSIRIHAMLLVRLQDGPPQWDFIKNAAHIIFQASAHPSTTTLLDNLRPTTPTRLSQSPISTPVSTTTAKPYSYPVTILSLSHSKARLITSCGRIHGLWQEAQGSGNFRTRCLMLTGTECIASIAICGMACVWQHSRR
jgi:hypothetical protein